MKKLIYLAVAAPLLLAVSCTNTAQTTANVPQQSPADTMAQLDEPAGNPIDFDKTAVLRSTYVVDRNGATMRQQASEDAKSLGVFTYGSKLDVIEETESWLGIRERITREFTRDGSQIESNGWEKVYVLKSQTGAVGAIALVPADLAVVSLLTVGEETEQHEDGKRLGKYLELELIDKGLFDSKKGSSVNFLLQDTLAHQKKNGVLELPAQSKTVRYADRANAEEDEQYFQYLGQVEFLNQFLINGQYWESLNYRFIDKTSGEETQVFGEYPHISADKKHIICIYANPYDMTADLELYSISGNKINRLMAASFKNWMPNGEQTDMFWAADGYLYTAVNHVNAFWKADGSLNDAFQYVRIKLL
ncbi:SH3 domain-containing protein [Sphingobacterium bambusae]|uniref:SH3 domain-containing protein n=1 Tax=Sphingobacterium bambusae TaxID=662858 RepID=A0ABW6BH30_9SPHI|nr:SH3 domain-containing protein [Sphingobacterium bambusae]WPL49703.1 SH3 domain-containing protein [Sphingobacterium bambusae]